MKRVIGLPGDIVEVADGAVFLNGHQLKEPYTASPAHYTVAEYQVPPDSYFVLGDNRNNSNDSSTGWTVPGVNIQGRAWILTWPPTKWGEAGNYNLSSQLAAAELSN
jgi:signal peptidase I